RGARPGPSRPARVRGRSDQAGDRPFEERRLPLSVVQEVLVRSAGVQRNGSMCDQDLCKGAQRLVQVLGVPAEEHEHM
ncbi:hypothetical protein LTR04_004511, partial [Oleoguttula sp. CCFEE 6159]